MVCDPRNPASVVFDISVMNALSYAEEEGVLFVAAAGNDAFDTDAFPNSPSSFPHPNVLSVAAVTRDDSLSRFSNQGRFTVDIAALGGAGDPQKPEDDILSTFPGNQYAYLPGTSMAAPHVAGAAALVLSHPLYSRLSGQQVKELLVQHARQLDALDGTSVSGGVLDVSFLGRDARQGTYRSRKCYLKRLLGGR